MTKLIFKSEGNAEAKRVAGKDDSFEIYKTILLEKVKRTLHKNDIGFTRLNIPIIHKKTKPPTEKP